MGTLIETFIFLFYRLEGQRVYNGETVEEVLMICDTPNKPYCTKSGCNKGSFVDPDNVTVQGTICCCNKDYCNNNHYRRANLFGSLTMMVVCAIFYSNK